MIINDQSASIQTGISSHYTQLANNNALTQAASKIFSILAHIKNNDLHFNAEQMRQYLLKEIHEFQIRAENLNYDSDSILVSRYALAACLDDIIMNTSWGESANWETTPLLQETNKSLKASERFFIILEKICQTPQKFIDTIELMYLCLSLGFEGKFRDQPNKQVILHDINDYLYQVIRTERGEIEKRLSPSIKQSNKTKQKKHFHLPLWSFVIFTFIISGCIFLGLNYLLTSYSNQTSQQLETVIHPLLGQQNS